jgi:hypothetical protein
MYVCMYIIRHICKSIRTHMCRIRTQTRAHTHVYTRRICTQTYIYIYTYIHASYMHANTYAHTSTYIRLRTYVRMPCMHARTLPFALRMSAYVYVCMSVYMYACTNDLYTFIVYLRRTHVFVAM